MILVTSSFYSHAACVKKAKPVNAPPLLYIAQQTMHTVLINYYHMHSDMNRRFVINANHLSNISYGNNAFQYI